MKKAKTKGMVPDSYSFHELLDRTSMFAAMVPTHLIEHHAFKALPPKARKKIIAAAEALGTAYQLIGEATL